MNGIELDTGIYIEPELAKAKLEKARETEKAVYITGRIGFGKTEFVRHYFNRDEIQYLSAMKGSLEPAFTQASSNVVVVDDISGLTKEEDKHLILELLAQKDKFVILIGRGPVPKWLNPAYLTERLMLIEEEDLRFSHKMAIAYFRKRGINLKAEEIRSFIAQVWGHSMAVKMLADHMEGGAVYEPSLLQRIMKDYFKYLEYALFRSWPEELCEFVMQLCIVDRFTIAMAKQITLRDDVEAMVERLLEIGSFLTEEEEEYIFFPLLIKSMRERLLREYPQSKRSLLYNRAGEYFESKDQLLQALKMYEQAENFDKISQLLIKNMEGCVNTSYLYELRHYYFELPESQVKSSVALMAGMSMLYSLLMNPKESEKWYRRLKQYEKKLANGSSEKKEAKSRIAYLDVGLPHRGSQNVKEMLVSLAVMAGNKKVALPEFSVTSNLPSLMNGGKDFCEWSPHDRKLALVIAKPVEFALGKYGVGFTPIALGESLYEKGEDADEVMLLLNRGRYQAENGGKIEMCFAAMGVLVRLHMCKGHTTIAEKLLSDFKQKVLREKALHLLPNLEALECRLALRSGKEEIIHAWMDKAPQEEVEFFIMNRYLYLTKIRVYMMMENWSTAMALIQRLYYYAKDYDRAYIRMETELLAAICHYRMGNSKWEVGFSKVLKELSGFGFTALVAEEGAAVLPLLKKCSQIEVEESYYKRLCKETEKVANYYPSYLNTPEHREISISKQAIEILRMQSEGMTAKEVAQALHITEATVRYHNKTTYNKLGASGKMDAVRIAKEMHILKKNMKKELLGLSVSIVLFLRAKCYT